MGCIHGFPSWLHPPWSSPFPTSPIPSTSGPGAGVLKINLVCAAVLLQPGWVRPGLRPPETSPGRQQKSS